MAQRPAAMPNTPAFAQYAEMHAVAPSFRVKGSQSASKDPAAMSEQDIAAALGMVGDELASEIFAACWAPDLARLNIRQVRDRLHDVVLTDYKRRKMALELAELELLCAVEAANAEKTPDTKRLVARARKIAEDARADRWPEQIGRYRRIGDAVLAEIAINNLCPNCLGRGVIFKIRAVNLRADGADMVKKHEDCKVCNGRGTLPVSDRKRAELLGIDQSTYRRNRWAQVYEWAHEYARDREARACRSVRSALMGF